MTGVPTDVPMNSPISRRRAMGVAAGLLGAATLPGLARARRASPLFEISLAEWSFHRMLRAEQLTNLDFPRFARKEFGIGGVEYVNSFFKDKARDKAYLTDLKRVCDDHEVVSVLIMCDGEGALGDPDDTKRSQAVENHRRWIEAAKFLGCHSIRVNAQSEGARAEQARLAADGLRRLCEIGAEHEINVIVENHGGLSSDGSWLAGVMKLVDHPRCGTLPDFGNFCLDWSRSSEPEAWYDRYKGVEELMPFAKGVSAKSHAFDEHGDETGTDYRRMLKIVVKSGYKGYIGVEYEGEKHSEVEGTRLTQELLERVRAEMQGGA